MGLSRYKVSYECDCGVNYGDCGAKCAWVVVVSRVSDVSYLFHVDTHGYRGNSEDDPSITQVLCVSDRGFGALVRALSEERRDEELTDLELKMCVPGGGDDGLSSEWKMKARKWDALVQEVARIHEVHGSDFGDIGEAAARSLGVI